MTALILYPFSPVELNSPWRTQLKDPSRICSVVPVSGMWIHISEPQLDSWEIEGLSWSNFTFKCSKYQRLFMVSCKCTCFLVCEFKFSTVSVQHYKEDETQSILPSEWHFLHHAVLHFILCFFHKFLSRISLSELYSHYITIDAL